MKPDNIVARIPGQADAGGIAITAHKDEIGGLVKGVSANGRVDIRRLGGSFSLGLRGRGCRFVGRSRHD
jgi:putative aminopeptidase FrvX